MTSPPRRDEPGADAHRGVEEIDIETGEVIGQGAEVDRRRGDIESPESPDDERSGSGDSSVEGP